MQRLKRLPVMWETWVQSLGQEDPLEQEMATHSSILASRIPWTEEVGGLQSTGHKEWDTTEWLHFHFHRPRSGIVGLYSKLKKKKKSVHAQSCPTLCHPLYYSLPGSSVHGIVQAKILKRVAISYSGGSSWPRDRTNISCVCCISKWILFH